MKFKLLRIAGVLVAAIGGALLGFSFGMGYMHNRIMDGLGLLEGGTPTYLDMDTLYHVSRLMSEILTLAKGDTLVIAGLVIISIGILIALLAPIRKSPLFFGPNKIRASNVEGAKK